MPKEATAGFAIPPEELAEIGERVANTVEGQERVTEERAAPVAVQVSRCGQCDAFHRLKGEQGMCIAIPPAVLFLGMMPHPVTQNAMPITNTFYPQVAEGTVACRDRFRPKVGRG